MALTQDGSEGTIKVVVDGPVAVVYIKRGQNRINLDFIEKLHHALDEVESKEGIQVLVTTGEGKFYSNGLDLNWLMSCSSEERDTFAIKWEEMTSRLLTFPMVTVAAINGHAFAAGGILSVMHDYRVMQQDQGWWCLNEVHLGIPIGPARRELLKMKLPSGITHTEVVILGKRFSGQQAHKAGIVQEICSKEALLQVAADTGKAVVPSGGYTRDFLANMKRDVYKHVLEMGVDNDDKGKKLQWALVLP